MTPAARIAAAIELLAAIEAAPARPADAVANDFFRARRFIGSGDRRAVSDRVWRVLRTYRRLTWWLARPADAAPAGRRLAAAGRRRLATWRRLLRRSLRPGAAGSHRNRRCCAASRAARSTIPRCRMRCGWRCRTGCCRCSPAPRAGRAGGPAGTRAARPARQPAEGARATRRAAALAAEGLEARRRRRSRLGPAHRGPPAGHHRAGLPRRPGRDPGRGQPTRRRAGRRPAGHARRRSSAPAPAARRWRWR